MQKKFFSLILIFLILFSLSAFAAIGRMWGDNGTQLSQNSGYGNYPYTALIKDGVNGGYIAFPIDTTSNSVDDPAVFVSRFNVDGQKVWGNDLTVDPASTRLWGITTWLAQAPASLPPANDAFIVWNAVNTPPGIGYYIYANRIKPDSTFAWASKKIIKQSFTEKLIIKKVFSDSFGNLFIVYAQCTNCGELGGTEADLYVAKLDLSGAIIFNKLIQSNAYAPNLNTGAIDAISDNAGGFIVIWVKESDGESFLARFNSTGAPVFSSISINKYNGSQLALSSDGGIFYEAESTTCWSNPLNFSCGKIFKRKLSDGTNFNPWPSAGMSYLTDITGFPLPLNSKWLPDSSGGIYYLFVRHTNDGSGRPIETNNIYATKIDNAGNDIWATDQLLLSTGIPAMPRFSIPTTLFSFLLDSSNNIYLVAAVNPLQGISNPPPIKASKFNSDGTIFSGWNPAGIDGITSSYNDGYFQFFIDNTLSNGIIALFGVGQRFNELVSSNTLPTVNITIPADGASFVKGAMINFQGSAADLEDDAASIPLIPSFVWSSSIEGDFMTADDSFSIDSSAWTIGTHTITLTATDSGGLSNSNSISIEILNQNAPVINAIECSEDNGINWLDCSELDLDGNIVGAVRAECTDPNNNISFVEFALVNPSGSSTALGQANSNSGSWWQLDNADQTLLSIGTPPTWELKARCVDSIGLEDNNSVSWSVGVPSGNVVIPGPLRIIDMKIEPFVNQTSSTITIFTTVRNVSSINTVPANLELTAPAGCTSPAVSSFDINKNQSHTFESTSICTGLVDGDYWVNANASSGLQYNATYRALFTVKQEQVLAVPETSMLLIPIILAVILILINSGKKKK